MKKITSRFITLSTCFTVVIGLSGCDLRGYIPKPYHAVPAPMPAPVPPPPALAPPPVQAAPAPDEGMIVPDMTPLPPAHHLPQNLGNPLDGS